MTTSEVSQHLSTLNIRQNLKRKTLGKQKQSQLPRHVRTKSPNLPKGDPPTLWKDKEKRAIPAVRNISKTKKSDLWPQLHY